MINRRRTLRPENRLLLMDRLLKRARRSCRAYEAPLSATASRLSFDRDM